MGMLKELSKYDEKYVEEVRERLADAAWEFMLAGSKIKAKSALKELGEKLHGYRKLFLEKKWVVLDKDLIPVSEWPKELKTKYGVE